MRKIIPVSQLTLALILAIISVIGAVAGPIISYMSNRSNTFIRVMGDFAYKAPGATLPEPTIRVLVKNTGKRDSVIKSATLTFEGVDAAKTELDPMNGEQIVVEPGKYNYVYLTAGTVRRLKGTRDQVVEQARQPNHFATITMLIVETDRHDIATDTPRDHRFETLKIAEWMDSHVKPN